VMPIAAADLGGGLAAHGEPGLRPLAVPTSTGALAIGAGLSLVRCGKGIAGGVELADEIGDQQ
jgi:hypothetical protein